MDAGSGAYRSGASRRAVARRVGLRLWQARPGERAAEAPERRARSASSLGEWFCWEADSEALDEIGHAAGVHLQREPLAEFAELVGSGDGDAAELDEHSEEPFEACRGDDLEDSAAVIAGVPERVSLSARFVNESPWACLGVVVTE